MGEQENYNASKCNMVEDKPSETLRNTYEDPELSAQDQAADPPDTLYDAMMSTTEAYVPATVKKVPKAIIVKLHRTPMYQVADRSCFPRFQLSYSHIQPIGWNDSDVASRAPISETRPLKIGIPLAMTYATTVMPNVHPIQDAQWTKVLAAKCLDPLNTRTNTCLLASYNQHVSFRYSRGVRTG